MTKDDQATTFFFWQVYNNVSKISINNSETMYANILWFAKFTQAVDEVNRGQIKSADRLYQLKALQDSSRKHEYVNKYLSE